MKFLITGGYGFLGSNIAARILEKGSELVIFDNLYRAGSHHNKEWLNRLGEHEFIHGDIRNICDVDRAIKKHQPDVVYHLAGQVAMTTSIDNPRLDFEVNVGGSFNLLNAIRTYSPGSKVIYSSSNKVYGDLEQFSYKETETRYCCDEHPLGFDESVGLDFHSPYGVSKGSADQYMLDFARIYGLQTVVFRHSSMFGGRQFATSDQGWIGWFIGCALGIQSNKMNNEIAISGNGKQVRDLLYADDCVDLYLSAASNVELKKGEAFNIGGGMENSFSIIELFKFLEEELDIEISYSKLAPRASDQKVFVADSSKAKTCFNWQPKISKIEGVRKMISWVRSN